MAKLTAPLLSQTAQGTIGTNLTFSERKSGSQVRWQKKQKDKITPARTIQRARFSKVLTSWGLYDFGIQNFGFFMLGGREVAISSFPINERAPQFAMYVRDFIEK